jgi:hypothetical protein
MHSAKQASGKLRTLSGIVILRIPAVLNTDLPRTLNSDPISNSTDVNDWHPEKQKSPIFTTVAGITMFPNEDPANARSSITDNLELASNTND